MLSLRRCVAVLTFLTAGAITLSAQTQAEVDKGRQLFLGMCSRCHGASGGGGEGPGLTRLTHSHNDAELAAVIRDGIPERGMPRVRRFSDTELRQMVGFVHSLGAAASGTTHAGDPSKGRALYQKLGCAGCHIVSGEGGSFGPELTDIGARRAPDSLRQSVMSPEASLPRGAVIPGRGFNEYLPVKITTGDGRDINGVRVNEDSFSIQVKDPAGHLYSFRKSEIKQLDKLFGKSMMPGYQSRATAVEIEDLVSYLTGLAAAEGGAK